MAIDRQPEPIHIAAPEPAGEWQIEAAPIEPVPQLAGLAGDELYMRQAAFNLERDCKVAVIGCGGVGVWAALAIALGGVRRLTLFDDDKLSLHNLNRLPFPATAVGQEKSVALANWLQLLRPDAEISARGNFDADLHLDYLARNIDWVVCCTDSLKSRKMIYAAAKSQCCRYIELGADGERWTLAAEPPSFVTELEQDAGYATVPVHVGPCMMAGAAAAYYVLHNRLPAVDYLGEWQLEQESGIAGLKLMSTGVAKSWDEVMAAGAFDEDITPMEGVEENEQAE